jgi:hypothetical protein
MVCSHLSPSKPNIETSVTSVMEGEIIIRTSGDYSLGIVTSASGKSYLAGLRAKSYGEKIVTTSPGPDAFDLDQTTRYLTLRNRMGELERAARLVSLANEFGMLPTMLNILSIDDLKSFSRNTRHLSGYSPHVTQANLRAEEIEAFQRILYENRNSPDKVFEIGGLFKVNPSTIQISRVDIDSAVKFTYLIGGIAYDENWNAGIQINHPSHTRFYRRLGGFPYQVLATNFRDYMGRQADILYLEGEEFRDAWDKFAEENHAKKANPVPLTLKGEHILRIAA